MENKALDLAWNFVNNTNRNIFLTGKAGTGKTTFLHKLKAESKKRLVVVAPTGVAAINAKGVTIHSFFQLPFGPMPPDSNQNLSRKFNKSKINLIKSLDLLIIDEVSMVRADMLDGIDQRLRSFRNRNLPFGGVQVLMIGDLQQLSPVIKDDEWRLLQSYYQTIFFFSSRVYQNCDPITIELTHIYRQENPLFINILNEIRNNCLTETSANELNKCYKPDFNPKDNSGYISLTTHNHKADKTNQETLSKLKSKSQVYTAQVSGNFGEHLYPNDEQLTLKVGAQVMFIKNDPSVDKRYYNGKIGKIIALDNNTVTVSSPDDDFDIHVEPLTWEQIRYTINKTTNAIEEDKIGSFTQIPLRLAWSITIHKSQGLTFEKAIIDAEDAFAHGQTYVALSRCKSLDGLILKSKISASQIINNAQVAEFDQNNSEQQPTETMLLQSKKEYQLGLIAELFDFYAFLRPIKRLLDIYFGNKTSIEGNLVQPIQSIKNCVTDLLKVSNTFKTQLQTISDCELLPEKNPKLQERFTKGVAYFLTQTKIHIETAYNSINYTTDNKTVDKDLHKQLVIMDELITTKVLLLNGLKDGFKVETLLNLRANVVFKIEDKPKPSRKKTFESTTNDDLFKQLRELRMYLADSENIEPYQVFTQKSLYAMCELLPQDKAQLKKIHGIGKARVNRFGDEILEVIHDYCKEHNLKPNLDNFKNVKESKAAPPKGQTKRVSLELFQQGKTIDEIASERGFVRSTIYGHLASFIPSGEVKVSDLMPAETYKKLKEIIPTIEYEGLSDLKAKLNDEFDYPELRLVVNELINH
jgi:hypothetical protein